MGATIHDVAAAAGTSIATVSRALNGTGRVSARTRQLIVDIAHDLDYRPGAPAARAVQTFAVVVSDITNPFFPELLEAFSREISAAGCLMLVSPDTSWANLARLRRRGVDGLVLVGADLAPQQLTAITAGLPVVALDRSVCLDTASTVRSDHAAGARLATRHLLELGHRAIAFLGGPEELEVCRHRRDGFLEAMRGAGLAAADWATVASSFDEAGGFAAMECVLEQCDHPTDLSQSSETGRITAVVACNDLMAIGALAALESRQVQVPTQVSIVGFDDIPFASYVRPRLTTVRQHATQLGRRAARLVIDIAHYRDSTVPVVEILPVELVRRESSGPRPA